jgi:hypothetical protein
MAQFGMIATLQIVLRPGVADEPGQAEDWISDLLSENPDVLDWTYLKVGGQMLTPQQIVVDDDYEEGEAFV